MLLEIGTLRLRGKVLTVPSLTIYGRTLLVYGKWLRVAVPRDEEVVEGDVISTPELFITELSKSNLRPDILTFRQRLTDSAPRFKYPFTQDNLAVIPIESYAAWWKALSQETRRNVRKAQKLGVTVRSVAFDDALVNGIKEIYDESPIRQGREFWHYGKDFETIKRENGTYLDRCEFLGAYYNSELIGYIKIIYVDEAASISQILSKSRHYDKRPTNALIAKAVEICEQKKKAYLVYCKYIYGNDEGSLLSEFKRRNGFRKLLVPRYYVPLTMKGRLAMSLKLHLGSREVLPQCALVPLLKLRLLYHRFRAAYLGGCKLALD